MGGCKYLHPLKYLHRASKLPLAPLDNEIGERDRGGAIDRLELRLLPLDEQKRGVTLEVVTRDKQHRGFILQ